MKRLISVRLISGSLVRCYCERDLQVTSTDDHANLNLFNLAPCVSKCSYANSHFQRQAEAASPLSHI